MAYEDVFKSTRQKEIEAKEASEKEPEIIEAKAHFKVPLDTTLNSIPEAVHNLSWHNRTICAVFDDLRTVVKYLEASERELSIVNSLIEEAQVYANRMEAALEDQDSYARLKEKYDNLEKKLKSEYPEERTKSLF